MTRPIAIDHTATARNPRRGHGLGAVTAVLMLCALLLLAACSSTSVRGEAPFAELSNWRLEGTQLSVDLRLRNVNDDPLELERIALTVSLDGGTALLRHEQSIGVDIPAGGFETIAISAQAATQGIEALEQLSRGAVPNLAYRLEGTVSSSDSGVLRIEREDRIYRVPGRPGEFR